MSVATGRIVCQFSCGAASAVATKLAIAQYREEQEILILNAFIVQEHPDNRRFLTDCERWFGLPIQVLRDGKYGASTIEVFRRKQFIKGFRGAPCSKALKRDLLDSVKRPDDVMVLGFTAEEADRFENFVERNPDRKVIAPLIERGLGKEDCKAMVQRAGIELPAMYRMGYHNANCIGCVKGGEGYWRAIREDFPAQFEEMQKVQEAIGDGARFLRYWSGPKKGERYFLRDLPDGQAVRNEVIPSCSFMCEIAEQEYAA